MHKTYPSQTAQRGRWQNTRRRASYVVGGWLAVALMAPGAEAKPIAFSDGWTFMHERDSEMIATELYYAPTHWFSFGPSVSLARADDKLTARKAEVLHANLLVKRWNMPGAQANVFASYGLGRTRSTRFFPTPGLGNGFGSNTVSETAHHAVLQGDYETRQFYSSFKFDAHRTKSFLDRTDTAQIGFSPYPHDYDDVALWFVGQVKNIVA
jgi:hypothetical protein